MSLAKLERMRGQGWKIDKFQWTLNFMWSFLTYIGVPVMVWAMCDAQDLNIPIDDNTFFAVFAVFLIISICRNLVHPPMYIKAKPEPVEAQIKETASS
jgi:hypothetical protein